MSRYKLALFFVFLIAASVAGGLLYFLKEGINRQASPSELLQTAFDQKASEGEISSFTPPVYDGYKLATVSTAPVVRAVSVPGRVEPVRSAVVSAERSGVITKITVSENVRVGPRVPLAYLESADLEAEITEQRLYRRKRHEDYLAARARRSRGPEAEETYEQARTAYERAEGRIRHLEEQLEQHIVRSPFTGTVVEMLGSVGQQVMVGEPLFKIGSLDHLTIAARIRGDHARDIKPGQRVIVQDSNDDGYEALILAVSRIKSPVDERRFIVSMPKKGGLKVGSEHKLRIITSEKTGFVIPVTAVDENSNVWIARASNGKESEYRVHRVPVNIEFHGDSALMVTDGLVEGDLILINPDEKLKDGEVITAEHLPVPYDEVQNYAITYATAQSTNSGGGCGGPVPADTDGLNPVAPSCSAPSGQ